MAWPLLRATCVTKTSFIERRAGIRAVWVLFLALTAGCSSARVATTADQDGSTGPGGDAASTPVDGGDADGPVCPMTVQQYCASVVAAGQDTTLLQTRDYSSRIQSMIVAQEGSGQPAQSCQAGGYSVSDCGAYSLIVQTGVDTSGGDYYDKTTGKLVAAWGMGVGGTRCSFGPPDQVVPPQCGPTTPVCDLVPDGGCDPSCAGSCDNGRCLVFDGNLARRPTFRETRPTSTRIAIDVDELLLDRQHRWATS